MRWMHRCLILADLSSRLQDLRPIVLFDGECNLCNRFVQTLLKYDTGGEEGRGNLRVAALQSRAGDLLVRRLPEELRSQVVTPLEDGDARAEEGAADDGSGRKERHKTVVLCHPDRTYVRSSAVLQIVKAMEGPSKRLRALQYVALLGSVLPTRVRDGAYRFVSARRQRWFGRAEQCLLWDARHEDRFVDDGALTGHRRDPCAGPRAATAPARASPFEGDAPPARGDRVRVVWPADSEKDPSVSYDEEFPEGVCLIGGTGVIATVDLPTRVVLRVDRHSLGLGHDQDGGDTMIAWVKPEEIVAM